MTEGDRALAIRVVGQVQGVGYRAYAQREAMSLGIKGWVLNRDDGSVEAALHGSGPALADLIGRLRRGPAAARVDSLDIRSTDRARVADIPDNAVAF